MAHLGCSNDRSGIDYCLCCGSKHFNTLRYYGVAAKHSKALRYYGMAQRNSPRLYGTTQLVKKLRTGLVNKAKVRPFLVGAALVRVSAGIPWISLRLLSVIMCSSRSFGQNWVLLMLLR